MDCDFDFDFENEDLFGCTTGELEGISAAAAAAGDNKKRLRVFQSDPLDYHSIMDAIKGCCGLFYSFETPSHQPNYDVKLPHSTTTIFFPSLVLSQTLEIIFQSYLVLLYRYSDRKIIFMLIYIYL